MRPAGPDDDGRQVSAPDTEDYEVARGGVKMIIDKIVTSAEENLVRKQDELHGLRLEIARLKGEVDATIRLINEVKKIIGGENDEKE